MPPFLRYLVPLFLAAAVATIPTAAFLLEEATIESIHRAFAGGELTSRGLVELYLRRIASLDPTLHAVVELDADGALAAADRADAARLLGSAALPPLNGIPVLIKDNIAAAGDGGVLNATAGSLALVGSRPARDAGVVERLRSAGAVILGTASLSEWCNYRAPRVPAGWSPRGGQGLNPYVPSATTCSSSSGSAIAAAANMVAVTIGTETDGSIMCPSSFNSVVGIKPTVGLTSRAGVIIISPRMDTVGPICRTVSDAVNVLEAIVGYDPRDAEATRMASQYIPEGGYRQFLNVDGLRGKRIGILRKDFFWFPPGSIQEKGFGDHFDTMRKLGAILVDNLEIPSMNVINDAVQSGERALMLAEFKLSLNSYLSELAISPVRSLSDIIDFNSKHPVEERTAEFGQSYLVQSEATNGIGPTEEHAIAKLNKPCKEGLEKIVRVNRLDAIVAPGASAHSLLAIGGYPAVTVPAGYTSDGVPFAICFGGLKGSEPKLIEISYSFEHATKKLFNAGLFPWMGRRQENLYVESAVELINNHLSKVWLFISTSQVNDKVVNQPKDQESTAHESNGEASKEGNGSSGGAEDLDLSKEKLVKLISENDELLTSRDEEVKDMKDKVLRSYAEMENVIAWTKRE